MHLIGYREQSRTRVGALLADNSVVPLGDVESFWADPYATVATVITAAGGPLNVSDLSLAPPVLPSARVLCVGLNYAAHVDEGPFSIPEYPTVFGRWAASLSVSGTPVAVPVDEAGLDWEGELLAVVGRPLKLATEKQAIDGVFAYAAFNDITARRAQKLTTQWTLGKNADNSGPMSALVTADEVGDPAQGLRIVTTVNGKIAQDGKTNDMLFTVGQLLAFVSRTFQLNPGDLMATGTPNGVGYARTPPWLLHAGDVVEVDIEKVGSIRTPVV
jgi:2,4-diketo-3-deoxy-L-fuconate hydrolase